MSDVQEIELTGCTPEPLMSYLKALGILRLVSEQVDTDAAACWRNDIFLVRSRLDCDELTRFFLEKYQPTPIIAPWNAGSGFYKKWDPAFPSSKEQRKPDYDFYESWNPSDGRFKSREVADALEAIERSGNPALETYRRAIAATRSSLADCALRVDLPEKLDALKTRLRSDGFREKEVKDSVKEYLNTAWLFEVDESHARIESADKDTFVRMMRSQVLDDKSLGWLDAALVLLTGEKKNRIEAPFLGSGGNIGNSDFSARFMQILAEVLSLDSGTPPSASQDFLDAAIWGNRIPGCLNYSVDQFNPGCAGGANMSQGTSGDPFLNPWDYVLMVEGAILLSGATTRRLDASHGGSAFPFSVSDSTPIGPGLSEADQTRGEIWLPLWNRLCSLGELQMLLAEGRAQIGRRRTKNGVDFARAVASFGVDRGIGEFVRLQFQKRLGDNFLATTLDRVCVRHRVEVRLLDQCDRWLDSYRFACSGERPTTPPRFMRALHHIEAAAFDYSRYGRREELLAFLRALGRAERELALRAGNVKSDKTCNPVSHLSTQWLRATHDGTPEFDIALALAGIHDRERKVSTIRSNIEPVAFEKGRWQWLECGPHVVWNSTDLATNMAAVLARRMMDGARAGCEDLPLQFHGTVPLYAVSAFITGDLDDRRIDDLLWGVMLIDHRQQYPQELRRAKSGDAPPLPREYALIKLLFLPRSLIREWDQEHRRVSWRLAVRDENGIEIRPEPRILSLLRAGRVADACRIAYQRLRSSGLTPLPGTRSGGSSREQDWEPGPSLDGNRLAASLLLPLSNKSVNELVHLVTRQDEELDSAPLVKEGADAS